MSKFHSCLSYLSWSRDFHRCPVAEKSKAVSQFRVRFRVCRRRYENSSKDPNGTHPFDRSVEGSVTFSVKFVIPDSSISPGIKCFVGTPFVGGLVRVYGMVWFEAKQKSWFFVIISFRYIAPKPRLLFRFNSTRDEEIKRRSNGTV